MKLRKMLPVFVVLLAFVSVAITASADFGDEQKLHGDANAGLFGTTIEIAGNTAVIGAPGRGSGVVYVYQRSGSNWARVAKLTAIGTASIARFGFSVDISEDERTIVVGAFGNPNSLWAKGGAVYVFERNGANWTNKIQDAKLAAIGTSSFGNFGFSVAVTGDGSRIVVGTRFDDDAGPQAGAAFVFDRNGPAWTNRTNADYRLLDSSPAAGDQFGFSLGIGWDETGDAIVVGAPGDDAAGRNAGAVFVYWISPGSGYQQTPDQELRRSNPQPGDGFGFSVDWASTPRYPGPIIIGAPGYPDRQRGSAYTYYWHEWGWEFILDEVFQAPGGSDRDGFGFSVDADRYYSSRYGAAIGAPGENGRTGAVYVYEGEKVADFNIDWTLAQRLSASDGAQNDRFGTAVEVALVQDFNPMIWTLMVGAPSDDDVRNNSGSVYLYSDDDY